MSALQRTFLSIKQEMFITAFDLSSSSSHTMTHEKNMCFFGSSIQGGRVCPIIAEPLFGLSPAVCFINCRCKLVCLNCEFKVSPISPQGHWVNVSSQLFLSELERKTFVFQLSCVVVLNHMARLRQHRWTGVLLQC